MEILNDLLCFDKLESGILELHKHDVTVMPFIANCVNMFGSQAKEAGIAMSNITGDGMPPLSCDLSYLSSSKLFQGDTVTMDKFKMDQVLRNLISNAMKFTPRGGSVTGKIHRTQLYSFYFILSCLVFFPSLNEIEGGDDVQWEKGCEGIIECGGSRDRRGKDDTMESGGKG